MRMLVSQKFAMHRLWRSAADLIERMQQRLFRAGWLDGVPTLDVKDVMPSRPPRQADVVDINSVAGRPLESVRAAKGDTPSKVATKK